MISVPLVVLLAIGVMFLFVAGGPIFFVFLILSGILYAIIRNGPAILRTFLSSFIPYTVTLDRYRKKLSVVYPCTTHFEEFAFRTRRLEDIIDEVPEPLAGDEVRKILNNTKIRFWLEMRFATRLMLPDYNDDGYLFVELGSHATSDFYYRASGLEFGRIAIINTVRKEIIAR